MNKSQLNEFIQQLYAEFDSLIPEYMKNIEDSIIASGNVAVCIMEKDGQVHGKLYGTNKIRSRESFQVAWTKASQVWITGIKTMAYEKLFFNNEIDGASFGIEAPDLIGWEGGQPVTLKDGTILSVGFSGFRGIVDIEIVIRAIHKIESM